MPAHAPNIISQRHILPITEAAASFDFLQHKLVLSAKGEFAAPVIHGAFLQLPTLSTHKTFLLVGWTALEGPGPVGIKFEFPFEISTPFSTSIRPGEYVTIITFNHPLGIKIPVRYLGFKSEPTDDKQQAVEAPTPTPSIRENKTIYVVEGEPFTISGEAVGQGDPKAYTISTEFDKKALTLQSSGIRDSQINWVFTAHRLGTTQVLVQQFGAVTPPAIGAWWVQTTYDVHVLLRQENHK